MPFVFTQLCLYIKLWNKKPNSNGITHNCHIQIQDQSVVFTQLSAKQESELRFVGETNSEALSYIKSKQILKVQIWRAFVVTSTQNHRSIHLFNIVEILNKYKISQDHQIRKFSNYTDLRKLDFLSAETLVNAPALWTKAASVKHICLNWCC